jgi:outer membrane immunogenic protein
MRFLTTVLRASAGSLACVLTSAMLTPALAADLSIAPIYKARPLPVANWTGTYVGVSGGGAWGSAVVRNDFTGADQTPRFDLSGAIVGATAGTQVQNGNLVLGFEGDISAASKKGTSAEFPPTAAFSNEIRERWLSTFRGRVGYARDNWLFYVTGGGAAANIENSLIGPPGVASETHWHWGWSAGGGVEVKITRDWSAKVEYLYVGLQDKSYFNPAPSVVFPSNQNVRLDDHIVRVGVNYKLPWTVLDSFFKR